MPNKKRGGKALTIRDVAEYAQVSAMTVSNVLNGRGAMTEATRQAVAKAIETLGYQPNPAARSLARAQSLRIGFVQPNLHNAFLSGVLVGALRSCGLAGAQMTLRIIPEPSIEALKATIDELVANGASGIMMTPPYAEMFEHSAQQAELALLGIPVVAVAPGRPLEGIICVRVDDRAATIAIIDHLVSLGHRRIGFVAGPAPHSSAKARADGYHEAMAAHGLVPDPSLVAQGTFRFESSMEPIRQLLSQPDPPSAIFASNDNMAAAVIVIANQLGLAVPGTLAVVGYDDTELASQVWPALTTVSQPVQEMARTAMTMLLDKITGHPVEMDQVMPFELVIRGSA